MMIAIMVDFLANDIQHSFVAKQAYSAHSSLPQGLFPERKRAVNCS
jgi:hypothetical protein